METRENTPSDIKVMDKLIAVAALVWLAITLALFSNTYVNGKPYLFCFLFGVLLSIAWFVRLESWRKMGGLINWRALTVRAITPLAIIIAILSINTGFMLLARLACSDRALTQYVADVRAHRIDISSGRPILVGLFFVGNTHLDSDGSVLIHVSNGWNYDTGFYYTQNTPPEASDWCNYEQLYGPWWQFHTNEATNWQAPDIIDILTNGPMTPI